MQTTDCTGHWKERDTDQSLIVIAHAQLRAAALWPVPRIQSVIRSLSNFKMDKDNTEDRTHSSMLQERSRGLKRGRWSIRLCINTASNLLKSLDYPMNISKLRMY